MKGAGARRSARFGIPIFLLALCSPLVAADVRTTGNVNFSFGEKRMNNDWDPVEDQPSLGIDVSWGKRTWPLHIVIDFLASHKAEDVGPVEFKGTTGELGLGLQKTWNLGTFHPFLGGGVAAVYGKAEVDISGLSVSEDDLNGGLWTRGGVSWRLGSTFNIGMSLRYSAAKLTFDLPDLSTMENEKIDFESGGFQSALLLGWGWPGH